MNAKKSLLVAALVMCGEIRAAEDSQPVAKSEVGKTLVLAVGEAAPAFKSTGEIADKFGVPKTPGGQVMPYGPDRKPLLNEAGEKFRIERKATYARRTLLIGQDGKVLYKNTKVIPANDAKQVLEVITKLNVETSAGGTNPK